MDRMDGLLISGVNKRFGRFAALKDISIQAKKGEFLCLLGPSGCGKTTLLKIIAGLERQDSGDVFYSGKKLSHLNASERNIGIVFQSYALFPNMTAAGNVAYGLESRGWSKRQISERVNEVMELVSLSGMEGKFPSQLSGGQQQRVALARAIAYIPDILLLDEPLSALDAKVRNKLRKEIRNIHEKTGITTVMVTHDQEEALTLADRIIVMNNGVVEQSGIPEEIYDTPSSLFVADFIGEINYLPDPGVRIIRPEHISIAGRGQESMGMGGQVEEIEFRGSYYRLQLKVPNGIVLYVNIPCSHMHMLGITRDSWLDVYIPPEKILYYSDVQAV